MVSRDWKERLGQPGTLPALPEILVKLRAGLYELNVDMDWLCSQLERDPALVGEILKIINCPLFGLRKIKTLSQAVIMLGLRRVRAIILSQSLRNSLVAYQSPGFMLYCWWDRSLLTAVSAAMLCQRSAPELAEEAYLAGLLADIGILVLARFEPKYERLLRRFQGRDSQQAYQAEVKEAGVDHCLLAGEIFKMWRFPEAVVRSALRHHNPAVMDPSAETMFVPRAVYFAARLTDCVVTADAELCRQLVRLGGDQLLISDSELGRLASVCIERYREIAAPLGHGQLADRGVPKALARPA